MPWTNIANPCYVTWFDLNPQHMQDSILKEKKKVRNPYEGEKNCTWYAHDGYEKL